MLVLTLLLVLASFESFYADVTQKWSNQQVLILINFKSRQQNLSEKVNTMLNLKKHFVNNGATVQNYKVVEDNREKTIWFYDQLAKNNKSSGEIGCISDRCATANRSRSTTSLPTYSADMENKLSWLDKIDVLINWIRNPDKMKRINFAVLNFEEKDNDTIGSVKNRALNRFDVMIGYLMLNILRGYENQNINIILVIENSINPEDSMLFARGPAFKQNFLANEKLGIDVNEMYSLMYFLIGLYPPMGLDQHTEFIKKMVDSSYYEVQTNLMESEKRDVFYYVNFMRTRNERLKEHETMETYNIYSTVSSDHNEFYILMLLIILMVFILLVQLGLVDIHHM